MSGPSFSDWMWWILGGLFGVAGFAALIWSLWWDRSRGRLRCPRCWYSMEGAPSLRCPECGLEMRDEREMRRTRRRWSMALLAVTAMLTASQFVQQPARKGEPWTRWVPTTVLACAMTTTDPYKPTKVVHALRAREMWGWQEAIVYLRDQRATPADLQACLKTRPVWPVGTPITVALSTVGSWDVPNIGYARVSVKEASGIGEEFETGNRPPHITSCNFGGRPPDHLEIPARREGSFRLEFDVKYSVYTSWGEMTLLTQRVPLDIRVAGTIRDHLRADADPALTDLIRSQIRVGYVGDDHVLQADLAWDPAFRSGDRIHTNFYPRVELLYRGAVEAFARSEAEREFMPWTLHPAPGLSHLLLRDNPIAGQQPIITGIRGDPADWTIRVVGDPETAARILGFTAFWDGSFEFPFTELLPPNS